MNRKIKIFTILLLLLTILGIWSPWDSLDINWSKLFGIEKTIPTSNLDVISLKDEFEVYIDDVDKGKASASSGVFSITSLEPGAHTVKLKKIIDNPSQYFEVNKSINLSAGFTSVIAYELGPNKNFSQGHIFYSQEGNSTVVDENIANLNVTSDQEGVSVSIDGVEVGRTSLVSYPLDLTTVHKLKLSKEGYENLEFQILPEDQGDRNKLRGADLYIEASLFLIPIEISS